MQNNEPLVSIVIPCYNHQQFVHDSIQSVINQSYKNIELIIIDDGSKDDSVVKIREMVELCANRFVRFEFRSRPNKGLSATLNEALEWCQGKYYSAIASDDQMLIRKTEIQVDYLESNDEIVAVFGGVKLIDENNIELKEWLTEEKICSFEEIIMHEHKLYAPTQMLRLDAVKGVDGYNSDVFIEDWYMWLKLSQNGKIACISDLLALYRKHDSNSSDNFEKIHQGRIEVLDFFKEHLLYKRALKNIIWINSLELFIADRKINSFLNLLLIDTKKTLKLSLKNIRKN